MIQQEVWPVGFEVLRERSTKKGVWKLLWKATWVDQLTVDQVTVLINSYPLFLVQIYISPPSFLLGRASSSGALIGVLDELSVAWQFMSTLPFHEHDPSSS